MISERTLDLAVAAGVITAAQKARLAAMERATPPEPVPGEDEEALRLVSGFSDIFVTIGLGLFLGAVAALVGNFAELLGAAIAVAVASWLLAELFTRRRRQALPSIVLLLTFSGAVGLAGLIAFGGGDDLSRAGESAGPLALAALATLVASLAHYWRFQVPITIAAAAAAAVALVLSVLVQRLPIGSVPLALAMLACGLCVFALALRIDASDRARRTRRTDIAFWLHMLAAPLIVHPVLSLVVIDRTAPTTGAAIVILALFALLAFVALVIDRRALMVSGLAYAGFAFGTLIRDWGSSSTTVPLTLLVLGGIILSLSTAWQALRAVLLDRLPQAISSLVPEARRGAV